MLIQRQIRVSKDSSSKMTFGARQLTFVLSYALDTVFRVQLSQDAPLLEEAERVLFWQ